MDNSLSQGPHKLIRDGAVLCAKLEDIVDALGPLPDNASYESPAVADVEFAPDAVFPSQQQPQADFNFDGINRAATRDPLAPLVSAAELGIDSCLVDPNQPACPLIYWCRN